METKDVISWLCNKAVGKINLKSLIYIGYASF